MAREPFLYPVQRDRPPNPRSEQEGLGRASGAGDGPAEAPIVLEGHGVTLGDVVRVARGGVAVALGPKARERMRAARETVDRLARSDGVLCPPAPEAGR